MPLNIYKGSSVPAPNGTQMLDQYGEHIETLYETGSRPLTAVGGTANVVTATMAIDVTAAGLVDGLCVSITWVAVNTSNVTLAINGGAAIPVVDARGLALQAGTLANGLTSVLRYTAGQWRIISGFGAAAGGGQPGYTQFTASGTWVKPIGYDDDTLVMIEVWGAGGGGGRGLTASAGGGGGGGGGYNRRIMRYADLPATVPVVIGSGGAGSTTVGVAGGNGGSTTFGSFLTGWGGGGGIGSNQSSSYGGGGGGENAAGATGSFTNAVLTIRGGAPGGGRGMNVNDDPYDLGGDARTIFGGGGGHGGGIGRGGSTVFGGAGGGGTYPNIANSLGGLSVFGGAGGASGVTGGQGASPAGGGGAGTTAGGAGGRGECRVWVMGG